jgi:hypothetical protein
MPTLKIFPDAIVMRPRNLTNKKQGNGEKQTLIDPKAREEIGEQTVNQHYC